ncbi:MAG TPA: hypothetical protein VJK30_04495 [Coxiellaceae bacterium]|nr:MAG: hypothetical protein A3E81_00135 [Gammaproteobacteria bacterium RIFCSPHIGHO2_12_FULL_36_30]HLB56569.1 hypothetical protein [Coxiellaceae bacterium]
MADDVTPKNFGNADVPDENLEQHQGSPAQNLDAEDHTLGATRSEDESSQNRGGINQGQQVEKASQLTAVNEHESKMGTVAAPPTTASGDYVTQHTSNEKLNVTKPATEDPAQHDTTTHSAESSGQSYQAVSKNDHAAVAHEVSKISANSEAGAAGNGSGNVEQSRIIMQGVTHQSDTVNFSNGTFNESHGSASGGGASAGASGNSSTTTTTATSAAASTAASSSGSAAAASMTSGSFMTAVIGNMTMSNSSIGFAESHGMDFSFAAAAHSSDVGFSAALAQMTNGPMSNASYAPVMGTPTVAAPVSYVAPASSAATTGGSYSTYTHESVNTYTSNFSYVSPTIAIAPIATSSSGTSYTTGYNTSGSYYGTSYGSTSSYTTSTYTPTYSYTPTYTTSYQTTYYSTSTTTTTTATTANTAPVITNLAGDSFTYSEGAGAIVIDHGSSVVVTDADSGNFAGGTLTVSFVSGSDSAEDRLAVRNQGNATGQIGVSGSNVMYGGVMIGSYTGGISGANLVINLNTNATPAATSALLSNITYQDTDVTTPTVGTRTIRFVLTDGDGGTSVNYDAMVIVNEISGGGGANTAPVITNLAGDSFTYSRHSQLLN